MDELVVFVGVVMLCGACIWFGHFIGWMRGYKEASDAALRRIPATMALGFLAGFAHTGKSDSKPANEAPPA